MVFFFSFLVQTCVPRATEEISEISRRALIESKKIGNGRGYVKLALASAYIYSCID